MKDTLTGLVALDINIDQSFTGRSLDVSAFKHIRVELHVLTCTGGATNNVALEVADQVMGDAAATYGTGAPGAYQKTGAATPWMVTNVGPDVNPAVNFAAGGTNGSQLNFCTKPEFLYVFAACADDATAFTARLRVVGFFV